MCFSIPFVLICEAPTWGKRKRLRLERADPGEAGSETRQWRHFPALTTLVRLSPNGNSTCAQAIIHQTFHLPDFSKHPERPGPRRLRVISSLNT
jgi:hypothetical protein